MSQNALQNVKTILKEIKEKIQELENGLDEIFKDAKSSLDIYSSLPWKPYKSGNGHWIRAEDAGELLQKLKQAKGNVIFTDNFRYVLSKDQRFIGRFSRRIKQAKLVNISTKNENKK